MLKPPGHFCYQTRHGYSFIIEISYYLLWHGYKNSRYVTVNGGINLYRIYDFDIAKIPKNT